MKHAIMVGLAFFTLLIVTREAHANERTGYGSWAVATAADPANNSSRYVAAVTDQSGGVGASVWVGSWDSSGTAWCTGTYVSTTALPSTVGGTSVVAYSSSALTTNLSTKDMLLFVTVYTSTTTGHLYYLANTGGDACSGWNTPTWTQISTGTDVPISAPGATSFTDSSGSPAYSYDFVAVLVTSSGSQWMDTISRVNGGSWYLDQSNSGTGWNSQMAVTSLLTSGNSYPNVYIFGTDGTSVLNEYSTAISNSNAAATWANSNSYTGNNFVNGDGLYYPDEACSATGNSGASPESNNRIIVVCGDNTTPHIHYWANIYPGTTYWAGTTTWYDQGAPSFAVNGTTEYATTRPAIGFFEDYSTTTDWMILGGLNPFTSLGTTGLTPNYPVGGVSRWQAGVNVSSTS